MSSLVSLGRGAEGSDPQPVTDPEPAPAPDLYIGSDLKKFNWLVLLGNKRDSMADALTGYVDDATVDREQKRAARESLKDIWAGVEVKAQTKPWHVIQKQQHKERQKRRRKRTKKAKKKRNVSRRTKRGNETRQTPEKEGKTTLYTLKSDERNVTKTLKDAESKVRESNGVRTASVTESEAASLSELSDTIGSGMQDETEEDDGIKPQWYRYPTHNQITEAAVDNWHSFEPEPSTDQMGNWSTWPDEPTEHSEISYTPAPDWFPLAESAGQAYAHAYNPDYIIERIDPTHPFPSLPGAAPHYTGKYMSTAINDESYKHLSFACHIIGDMAMPFHTGAWVRGTFIQKAHSRYEEAVNANIKEDYLDQLENIDNCHVVPDSPWWDPDDKWSKHTKNLANKSSDYADSFATKIAEASWDSDNPGELIDSCGIEDETQQLLDWATMYAMGLIREFKREVQ